MKLSFKNIITIAILLASSLKTLAHPIEIKGVEELIQEKEKVHPHLRDEIPEEKAPINVKSFGSILDLVCRSNIKHWCTDNDKCSYVKTLCVRNDENNYCAFDVYKKFLLSAHNNTEPINYDDICDQCLIDMVEEFQNVSNDSKAIRDMRNMTNLCKIKSRMGSILNHKKSKLEKKNYNGSKIHSYQNPEGGFVKSNGKIEYGHVGINEKINAFIHNNRNEPTENNSESEQKEKRQEVVIVQVEEQKEEIAIIESIKEKISVAIEIVKGLAIQEVEEITGTVEEDDTVIKSDTNDLSNEILDNIKEIFNIIVFDEENDVGTEALTDVEVREIGTDAIEEVITDIETDDVVNFEAREIGTDAIEETEEVITDIETDDVVNFEAREIGTDAIEETEEVVTDIETDDVVNFEVREIGTDAIEETEEVITDIETDGVFNVEVREIGTDAIEETEEVITDIETDDVVNFEVREIGTDAVEETEEVVTDIETDGVFNVEVREIGTDAIEETEEVVTDIETNDVFNVEVREIGTDAIEETEEVVTDIETNDVFNVEVREIGTDAIEETEEVVTDIETDGVFNVEVREIGTDGIEETEEVVTDIETDVANIDIREVETNAGEEEETTISNVIEGELPPLPIVDIFDNINKKTLEKKVNEEKEDSVFNVDEEANYDVFIAETPVTEPTDTSVPEEDAPTESVQEENQELPQGKPPVVEPENPLIKPGKPSWPVKPSIFNPFSPFNSQKQMNPFKFGWPFKFNDHKGSFGPSKPHGPHGPNGPSDILQHINKVLEENKSEEVKEVRHQPPKSHFKRELNYNMKKNWLMKKSKLVVNNEHFEEEMVNEPRTENNVESEKFHTHVIKINNADNQRHHNEEEEVFEIGTKKVQWVNNAHPNKPSISFRKNNKDTH